MDFERGLNKVVVKIRRALGDLAESPRFVETLERRGYRFIAPVEAVQPPSASTADSLVPARIVCDDRSIPLPLGEHLLGRDPGCAVGIDSSFVSRRHADRAALTPAEHRGRWVPIAVIPLTSIR